MHVFRFLGCALVVLPIRCIYGGLQKRETLRGVQPKDQARYSAAAERGTFECEDGSHIALPFSVVNDDFCDCADGSDEPGTAACAGQKATLFYCPNVQSAPSYIYASRINDGICDCCDGSDEMEINCQNSCEQEGRHFRKDLERRQAAWDNGVAKRAELIRKAQRDRENNARELSALRERLPILEAAEKTARVSLENATETQKEAQTTPIIDLPASPSEDIRDTTGDVPNTDSASMGKENGAAISEYAKWMEGAGEVKQSLEEKTTTEASQGSDESLVTKEFVGPLGIVCDSDTGEILELKEGRQGEKSGLRIGWHFKEINGKPFTNKRLHDAIASGKAYKVTLHGTKHEDAQSSTLQDIRSEALESREDAKVQDDGSFMGRMGKWGREAWNSVFGEARSPFDQASKDLSDAKARIETLENNLKAESDEILIAYATLEGRCLYKKLNQYKYEICFFDRSKQDSTSLGTWKGWESSHVGLFDNGQYCAGGPARSLRVYFECGPDEEISHVMEPSRCAYEAKIVHPGACVGAPPAELSHGQARMPTDEL